MPANPHHSPSPQDINNSRLFWVTPQSQLERVLNKSKAGHLATFTSDAASIFRPRTISKANYLMLAFNDISAPAPDLVLPSAEHIQTLLEFHASLLRDAPLVLSCYAGISRSTAAAYILACAAQPLMHENDIALKLRRATASATPNILMVCLADKLLGRDGRMVKAIEAIGRGSEAFEGTPFYLDLNEGADKIISAPECRNEPIGENLP